MSVDSHERNLILTENNEETCRNVWNAQISCIISMPMPNRGCMFSVDRPSSMNQTSNILTWPSGWHNTLLTRSLVYLATRVVLIKIHYNFGLFEVLLKKILNNFSVYFFIFFSLTTNKRPYRCFRSDLSDLKQLNCYLDSGGQCE